MTRQEYLEAAEKRYDELQRLNLITDFYDYETEFVKIWQDLGREVLEKNISKPGNDKRKKNLTTLGYVTINNTHPFSKGKNGFQISPKLQELMVYSAQTDSYENCNEVLEKYINIEVSAAQVWRIANVYGEEVGKTISDEVVLTPYKKEEVIYA